MVDMYMDKAMLKSIVGEKKPSAAEVAKKTTQYIFTGAGLFFIIVAFLVSTGKLGISARFFTDILILGICLGSAPWIFAYLGRLKKIEQIDEKLPDFLRDLAESARAGMTLPRALVAAGNGEYGELTKEIRIMAAQVEWGVSFGDALQSFAMRTKTPLINRIVDLIIEAQEAGGNMVDVLSTAGEDARELQQILIERNQQMQTYSLVIYVAYFVFLAVVVILVSQFIPAFKDAVTSSQESGTSGAAVGGLNIQDFDPEDFKILFFQAALLQGLGGGLVGGVLTKGRALTGMRSVFVMWLVAFIVFRGFL